MTDTPNDQPTGDMTSDSDGRDGDGMVTRWMKAVSDQPDAGAEDKAGDQVGAYRLIRQLGEGGFGTVWLAERKQPFTQRVALKLIKPGMDSKSVIARFEQERQALAVMNHPGIAKVLDGGLTPKGRPYFAMEFVKGEAITEFCDTRRLSVRERLVLFIQACEAVQHAHLKGIVHRDIKPSNILAFAVEGEEPRLKVIDFGVAKAMSQTLTEKTIFTETGQMIGTPAYMSPEQADPSLSDIDTRSDIYSLGVLLYELVTGALPFDPQELRSKAIGEIQRIIREEEPPAPSVRLTTLGAKDLGERAAIERARGIAFDELAKQLRAELEWIPLKAMRKEPHRRYQSAAALAEEVRSYLEGRPLLAAPESTVYRIKKYMLRNRAMVIGSCAVALALLIGLTLATVAFINMREEKLSADQAKVYAESQKAAAEREREQADGAKKRAEMEATNAETQRKRAEEALQRLEDRAYFENIQLASAFAELGATARLRERLSVCEKNLRNWEWFHLDRICDESLATLSLGGSPAHSLRVSPTGAYFLSVHGNDRIGVWRAETSERAAYFDANQYIDAVFGDTDDEVLLLSIDGKLEVGSVRLGKARATDCEFSFRNARLFRVADPQRLRLLIVDSDGVASLAQRTGRGWQRIGSDVNLGGSSFGPQFDHAEYSSASGQLLARMKTGSLRFYDLTDGGKRAPAQFSKSCSAFDISRDGTMVAVAEGEHFRILRAQQDGSFTDAPLADNATEKDPITRVDVSDSGQLIALARGGAIEVWRVGAATTSLWFREGSVKDSPVSWIGIAPDARKVAWTSTSGMVYVRVMGDAAEARMLRGHKTRVALGAWHSDSALLATASEDGELRFWDSSTPAGILAVEGPLIGLSANGRQDGLCHAAFCSSNVASIWLDIDRPELKSRDLKQAQIRQIDAHPFRAEAIYATNEKRVYLWEPSEAVPTLLGTYDGSANLLRFSPDGTLAVLGSGMKSIHVWDVEGRKEATAPLRHEGLISVVAFSSRSSYMATAAANDGLFIWDTRSWTRVAVLGSIASSPTPGIVHAEFLRDRDENLFLITDAGFAYTWDWKLDKTIAQVRLSGGALPLKAAAVDDSATWILTVDAVGSARVQEFRDGAESRVLMRGQAESAVEPVVRAYFISLPGSRPRVLTVSESGSARLWDGTTGEYLMEFRSRELGQAIVALSSDGTRCIVGTKDGAIRVLDCVPYRVRFAEAALRQQGKLDNLGRLYVEELRRGEARSRTWLTDPQSSVLRPNFARSLERSEP